MNIAVIVPTYNRPDALAAVLAGYEVQEDRGFELVVADDGSTVDTADVVHSFQRRGVVPIRHVWQEDLGFRLAAVRNRAVAATSAEYIIFTDGDCVPSKRFVSMHRRLAEPGFFLGANRVLLSPEWTQRVLKEHIPLADLQWAQWLRAWACRDVNRLLPLIALPDGAFRKWEPHRWKGIKTCNLSIWRSDLVTVNGVDESYEGWGLEDSDLVIRLLRSGVKHKSARYAAPVFHLWHREQPRTGLDENQRRLDRLLQSQEIRAAKGLDQYPMS